MRANPGEYVQIEQRARGQEPLVGVVLITWVEARDGYDYVGWRNEQPGGGWDRRLGAWGAFRVYPEPREWGTVVTAARVVLVGVYGPGDCYEVAAQIVLADPDLVLCHGTAYGTGGDAEGIWFGHAWVETTIFGATFVIDRSNGHDHFGPKEVYYRAGNLRDVTCYSRIEAAKAIVRTKHWGPWR